MKVRGYGKPAHEEKLAETVEALLQTSIGEDVIVERLP